MIYCAKPHKESGRKYLLAHDGMNSLQNVMFYNFEREKWTTIAETNKFQSSTIGEISFTCKAIVEIDCRFNPHTRAIRNYLLAYELRSKKVNDIYLWQPQWLIQFNVRMRDVHAIIGKKKKKQQHRNMAVILKIRSSKTIWVNRKRGSKEKSKFKLHTGTQYISFAFAKSSTDFMLHATHISAL